MITPRKIDEWIREAEARPASAPEIIRLIANRLGELDQLNEQLRDENIQLRTGLRVEDYQRRIDNLEYQLDLLKRQLSPEIRAEESNVSLIIYSDQGQIFRIDMDFPESGSSKTLGKFRQALSREGSTPRLLLVDEKEEALFLFDSGRVSTLAVAQIPNSDPGGLEWELAFLKEPGIGEELAAVLPSARMSLYEFCIQASRRGFIRKIIESFFENHLSRGFIGSGVNLDTDRTCGLAFGDREDIFVMVSREGMVFSLDVARMPLTVEEAIRLSPTDYITSLFTLQDESHVVFVTQNGKVIHREVGWLDQASALKTKGQPLFSKERRESGVRIVGAGPAREDDWCVALLDNGQVHAYLLADLFAKGSIFTGLSSGDEIPVEILSFAVFNSQLDKKASGDG